MTTAQVGPCAQVSFARIARKLLAFAAIALAVPAAARAEMLEIQLGGVDIGYDGTNIFDAGAGDPDPLNSVAFLVDGVQVGSVLTSDITLDLFIPDVLDIADTGDVVVSGAGGFFDIGLPGADFLDLDLDAATITYVDLTTVQFAYAGSVAAIDGQSLPFGLEIGDPVSISFSTQIDPGTLVTAGGFVEEFTAFGTGEVRGILVPEPASVVLGGLGGLALLGLIWRRRKSA
ncbi:MAG: PEP-CTERM sorting domain-containing protein [Planctomycetota bacterium]|nr:MAG: PEP-CTERM sorting domain-containing protein [Planctomycetota bacterium]